MKINYRIIHDIERNYIHKKMPGKLIAYLFDHYSEDIYDLYADKKDLYDDILIDIGRYDCGVLKPIVRTPMQRMREQYEELKRYNAAVLDDYHGMLAEYDKMSDFIRYHRLFKLYHEYEKNKEPAFSEEVEELPFM